MTKGVEDISGQSTTSSQPYLHRKFWMEAGNTLVFSWNDIEVFFEMPEDWVYSETHTDLFQLAHHLLVEPWDKSVMDQWQPTRQPGWRPGLAFSGGVDSAAALCLMPDSTVLLYHERCALSGKLSHANAHRFFEHIESTTGRRVHRIRSNHEKIRQTQGQSIGFSTDYACAVHAVLLADYFSLDSIATGMPLENSYLFHGHQYRDFASSRFWKHYSKMFADVGLPLYQPVAGCSEVVNLAIVQHHGWDGWAQSCLRSPTPGKVCGSCWKCFRKNTLQGDDYTMSSEISTFLKKKPLKQAVSTLYSIQRGKLLEKHRNFKKDFEHLATFLQ
ncbi:MAG: DUF6395 domain-containing protein, partial [Candidatus Thermoplasmatota archaeon]|nr:DUF6395 domain-containing protein [Candidatus Thermoplasmatota archaeon]